LQIDTHVINLQGRWFKFAWRMFRADGPFTRALFRWVLAKSASPLWRASSPGPLAAESASIKWSFDLIVCAELSRRWRET
jgi:hypothetical protein